jgi:hypothetical protein
MTAYTSAASGDWNNTSTWSPAGIPTSADTATVGAHTIQIPASYAAEIGAMTLAGTGSGTRAKIVVNATGSLKHFGDLTCSTWNEVSTAGTGTATWDLNGNDVNYTEAESSSVHNRIVNTRPTYLHLKSTGALSTISDGTFQPAYGFLDISNFKIENVSLRFGGSFFSGHHCRVYDGVFYNHGFFRTYSETNAANDWSFHHLTFDQAAALDGGVYAANFACLTSAGNSLRDWHHIAFKYSSVAVVRTERFQFVNPSHIYVDNVQFENVSSPSRNWECVFHARTIFGELGYVDLLDSFVTPNVDNPHTFGLLRDIKNTVIEAIYPGGSTDGGDHLILDNNNHTIYKSIFIDGRGGVILNALGSAVTGTYTLDHVTYVADVADSAYGQLVRNESGGTFGGAATLTVKSTIAYRRSGNTSNRVFNMETSGNDQVEYVDYNRYYGNGTTDATTYYQVTSATKGAIGSQTGWGANDKDNEDPQFANHSAGLVSWATQYGATTYNDAINYIIYGLNGYDPTTHEHDSGLVTGHTVKDLLGYMFEAFRPSNPDFQSAGADGLTIGASPFVLTDSTSDANIWRRFPSGFLRNPSNFIPNPNSYVSTIANGFFENPPVLGSFAGTAESVSSSISGTVSTGGITGAFSGSTDNVSSSISGNVRNTGSFAGTLSSVSSSISATVKNTGAFSGALASVSSSIAGNVINTGSFSGSTASLSSSMSGNVVQVGSFTGALDSISSSITGTVSTLGNSGAFSGTLDSVTSSISVNVRQTGSFSGSSASVSSSISGNVRNTGSFASQTDSLGSSISAQVKNTGSFSGSLDSVQSSISVIQKLYAEFSGVLNGAFSSISGTVETGDVFADTNRIIYIQAESYRVTIPAIDYSLTVEPEQTRIIVQ